MCYDIGLSVKDYFVGHCAVLVAAAEGDVVATVGLVTTVGVYERGALADLDEIFAYIAADNRKAAGRLVTRIEHAAARIIGGATQKAGFRRFQVVI